MWNEHEVLYLNDVISYLNFASPWFDAAPVFAMMCKPEAPNIHTKLNFIQWTHFLIAETKTILSVRPVETGIRSRSRSLNAHVNVI